MHVFDYGIISELYCYTRVFKTPYMVLIRSTNHIISELYEIYYVQIDPLYG